MSRGFSVVATVQNADDLTVEKLADEIDSNGLLSELEKTSLLPGSIAVAKIAIGYLGAGPYRVTMTGTDRSQEQGEVTSISITVGTLTVIPAQSPSPTDVVAPAVETPVVETPVIETAPVVETSVVEVVTPNG